MIDYLFDTLPSTTVILSTLVPNHDGNVDNCVKTVNQQFKYLVTSYQSQGRRIALADMYSFLTQDDITSDGTHPNDYGYKKMASVWWDAFKKVAGSIQAPDNSINDADDALPPTCAKVAGNGRGPVQTQRGSGWDDGNYRHSSVAHGTILNITDAGPTNYHFAQLVNSGGADRGGELDELILTEKQTDGSFKYSFRLNTGGAFASTWTSFTSPLTCSGDVGKSSTLCQACHSLCSD